MVKQVIVMRRDLNMRSGKMVAQGAHASLKVFLDRKHMTKWGMTIRLTKDMVEWITNAFTKVCLKAESEEQLLDIVEEARRAKLPCALITDAGKTEFNGIPTNTCCAIGPARSEEIDKITGHLKLY